MASILRKVYASALQRVLGQFLLDRLTPDQVEVSLRQGLVHLKVCACSCVCVCVCSRAGVPA